MEETGRETEDYYKIINELKDENRQLKTKKTEQKLKNANSGGRKSTAGSKKSIIGGEGSDLSRRTDENQQLNKTILKLKQENEHLQTYAKKLENEQLDLKDAITQHLTEIAEEKRKIIELNEKITRNELDLKINKTTIEEKDQQIKKLVDDLFKSSKTVLMDYNPENEEEKTIYEKTIKNMKLQLLNSNNENYNIINEIQSELYMTKLTLNKQKLDYEEEIQNCLLSLEIQKTENEKKYEDLKNEYLEFKNKENKNKEILLEEQNIIIRSLQSQFDLYRNTVEYLFQKEITRLKEIIKNQMIKYELEITKLCNMKEYNYEQIISSKDSKIMNLIEGTDIQSLILKYESEINDIKKNCREETNRIIDNLQRSQSEELSRLNNDILGQQEIIENLKDNIENLNVYNINIYYIQNIQNNLNNQIKRKDQTIHKLENQLSNERDNLTSKITEQSQNINKLEIKIHHLKHLILQYKLNEKGETDESLKMLTRYLNNEMVKLNDDYNILVDNHKYNENERNELLKSNRFLESQNEKLKNALESQTREFNNLNKTLKTVINHRVTTLNSINEENNSNKRIFSYEKHQIVPIYHGTGVGIPKALETIRRYTKSPIPTPINKPITSITSTPISSLSYINDNDYIQQQQQQQQSYPLPQPPKSSLSSTTKTKTINRNNLMKNKVIRFKEPRKVKERKEENETEVIDVKTIEILEKGIISLKHFNNISKAYSNGNYELKKDKEGNLNRIIMNNVINDNDFLNTSSKVNTTNDNNYNNNEEDDNSEENENKRAEVNKSINIIKYDKNNKIIDAEPNERALSV